MRKLRNRLLGLSAAGAMTALIASTSYAADFGGSMKDEPMAEPKSCLELSANVALTTDYVFRGQSQTDEGPALQGGFDAACGMFYAGVWGSNLDFDDPTGNTNLELDFYGGIKFKLGIAEFDLGLIYYAYPNAPDAGAEADFLEIKAGVSGEIVSNLTGSLTAYYSPEYTGEVGENFVFEAGLELSLPKFAGLSPALSGTVGIQEGENSQGGIDYTYWNAGLAVGFMEKFTFDIRYWDTDISGCGGATVFQCDARAVATLSASF